MQFPCARCSRTYEIADELCVGRAVKVACPACGNLAVHRVAARAAPEPPRPPPSQVPSPFAESDDDDFENAWSALEAPPGAAPRPEAPPAPELSLEEPTPAAPFASMGAAPEPPPPRVPPPAAAPRPAPPPAAVARPAPPAAKAPAPVRRPPAPVRSLEDEEPVMVTAELVLRRSNRRARIMTATLALVAIAAVVGGGALALKFKRSAGPGARRGAGGAAAGGSAATLSEADIAKLMGRKEPEPVAAAPERAAPRAPAADRPKHEKLALKDRELLDLLSKKGDAAVTVQDDELAALSTTRGALDESAIEGTLSRNSASFASCVSRAIATSPDQRLPATKVNLELTIRPSGRVSKSAVQEAAIAKLPLGQCIAAAAKRMVFPGFDGEALDIVVPLKLKVGL